MPDGWESNCGPGGLESNDTLPPGFMTMHVCCCGPGGRWWQRTTRFMTMQAVMVTWRLTAEYGISCVPNTRPMNMGLNLYLNHLMSATPVVVVGLIWLSL